jgi:hypothetical protein
MFGQDSMLLDRVEVLHVGPQIASMIPGLAVRRAYNLATCLQVGAWKPAIRKERPKAPVPGGEF